MTWRDDAVEAFRVLLDEFGEPVSIAGADPVQAIYSHKADDALGMQGYAPSLEVLEDELPEGLAEESPLVFRGKAFVVGVITTDGDGVVALRLREA